jgi:hypothetical protein
MMGGSMMRYMMGGMMWGMGLISLLVVGGLVIAALVSAGSGGARESRENE